MIRYILIMLIAILCLFIAALSFAQETPSNDELWEMGLEELLNMTVVTASKQEQLLEEAPAIIDVITASQIREMNINSLYELISYLPGIEVYETFWNRTLLNFRGVLGIAYLNRILLMINGNPIYEGVNGSCALELMPIDAIERIEVIRGPGSPLYGTNAYAGVINIITRKGDTNEHELRLGIGGGSFSTIEAKVWGNLPFKGKSGLFAAMQFRDDDGYDYNVLADERGHSGNLKLQDDVARFFSNYSVGPISVDLGYYRQEKRTFGLVPVLDYTGFREQSTLYANLQYQRPLSDNLKMDTRLRFNRFSMPKAEIGYFPSPGFAGHDTSAAHMETGATVVTAEAMLDARQSDRLSNISGLVLEYIHSDKYAFVWDDDQSFHPFSPYKDAHDNTIISMYSEFRLKPTTKLDAFAGVRLVYDREMDNVFPSPRGGFILHVREGVHFKTLYGQAYRSPAAFEKYVSTYNVIYGSTDLEAEKIQTIDVALELKAFDRHMIRINGFQETTHDLIVRTPTDKPDVHGSAAAMYINQKKGEQIYGVEFSANGALPSIGRYGFNTSFRTGENQLTEKELKFFAHVTANFWLQWRPISQITIMPYLQYVGTREGVCLNESYTLDPYTLANLTITLSHGNASLSLTGKNLLDQDYAYPEYLRQKTESVPGGPERSFFVMAEYCFF